MLLFCALLLFAQNTASATPDPEVAWYSAPNSRGTWDLIVSCVLTLVICVWSALHLNVPVETSRLRERNIRRLRWVLLGIFAPEVVVSTAFAQFLTARWLRNEIRADIEASEEWSLSQCYFAVMGGIVIETGAYIADEPHLSITAEGVRLLSFLDKLPKINNGEVRDKSKADDLAKFLVVLQAGWMIIQCIARVAQDLPVTLLEVNTIGHVVCAFALYMLWWRKPLDIKDPHKIVGEHGLDKHIALMYMCSPKVFFTWSTLGIFVGEPIYIADRVPNFPGFSYLGSVNVQRDILKTVVAFAGAAYGGLHLSAWNDYFPTQAERIMWIASACATGLTGLVLALFFLATNKLQQLEAAENRMRNNKRFKAFLKGVLVPLFVAARVFIVVEAFICLRRQPEAIYKTPEWSNYIPHL
ncbi:uncharacterized protein M421DRAFT_68169 [Didymella exigua CBS 183.55]|uniref:Uncharacterized protein n=1 Tax=Didymella exigua CBS 183.55 TaxID=1150837 RepID=A0A6A5RFG1_9PLEO|nr:uncharacterized protein M421DRAFT_68169 [Didymella exigua CBS 183.55]KAF1926189.1 hypothetical protein M421DRAFT_68169 [Didymella exigua CBS 183.55]